MANLSGPTITCWGAARSVTGSMHLVDVDGFRLLLDCGLFLGARHEAHERNSRFPFDPHAIDAVVLSHAHIDHCGNLPNLVHQGFAGPIYCTRATRDLLALMLADSARIHEEEAFVLNVLGQTEPETVRRSIRADTDRTLGQCVALPYVEPHEIGPGIKLRFVDAGHILGSAMVTFRFAGPEKETSLTFTGDLGRPGMPLSRPPAPVPAADLILCESTYGGRTHDPVHRLVEELAAVVRRTVERGGKVLIQAFSLGRTQVVVHTLRQAMRARQLLNIPVFADSPLAADITEVYRQHLDDLDLTDSVLADGDFVRYLRSPEESRELSLRREPLVIVASGRFAHHLKQFVDDPRCSIVLVSYQPPHTLGRRLLERGPIVRFHGRRWNKWADVVYLPGFSGHADHHELLAALRPLAAATTRVRLVHGESEQAEALAASLRSEGFPDVAIPHRGETMDLAGNARPIQPRPEFDKRGEAI